MFRLHSWIFPYPFLLLFNLPVFPCLGNCLIIFFTLLIKNVFIVLAISLGFVKKSPLKKSWVGDFDDDQPNQPLTFCQILLEFVSSDCNLLACQFDFSFFSWPVIIFLNLLYSNQSSLFFDLENISWAWSLCKIYFFVRSESHGSCLEYFYWSHNIQYWTYFIWK